MSSKYAVPVLAALTLFDVVGATAQAQENNFDSSYVGAAAGYQFNEVDIDTLGESGDLDRFVGGAFAGHNFRFGNLVLGIEGGIYASEKKTFDLTSIDGSVVMSGLQGEARGRVGFVVSNGIMIYGAGGGAFGKLEFNNDDSGTTEKETLVGYTVGGGIEAAFTPSLTGRVDVTFTDYGDEDMPPEVGSQSTSVKAGIALNF